MNDELEGIRVVPQLRWLLAGFPPRPSGFDPWSVHVGFVVGKMQ
jgi:hypothetical protein